MPLFISFLWRSLTDTVVVVSYNIVPLRLTGCNHPQIDSISGHLTSSFTRVFCHPICCFYLRCIRSAEVALEFGIVLRILRYVCPILIIVHGLHFTARVPQRISAVLVWMVCAPNHWLLDLLRGAEHLPFFFACGYDIIGIDSAKVMCFPNSRIYKWDIISTHHLCCPVGVE